MDSTDFGWGKPVYFGLGYVCALDRGIIVRDPQDDGSLIVIIELCSKKIERSNSVAQR